MQLVRPEIILTTKIEQSVNRSRHANHCKPNECMPNKCNSMLINAQNPDFMTCIFSKNEALGKSNKNGLTCATNTNLHFLSYLTIPWTEDRTP